MPETRAEKAQRLDEGRVEIIQSWNDGVKAKVWEKRKRTPYLTILYTDGVYYCDCPWRQLHPLANDLCAHALAVKLAVERGNP